MDEQPIPTLVGVAFLCQRWNVSKQKIYNMIQRGDIKAENINEELQGIGDRQRAAWRVPMHEVIRWESTRSGL